MTTSRFTRPFVAGKVGAQRSQARCKRDFDARWQYLHSFNVDKMKVSDLKILKFG
jgi:hypothetical protein